MGGVVLVVPTKEKKPLNVCTFMVPIESEKNVTNTHKKSTSKIETNAVAGGEEIVVYNKTGEISKEK